MPEGNSEDELDSADFSAFQKLEKLPDPVYLNALMCSSEDSVREAIVEAHTKNQEVIG